MKDTKFDIENVVDGQWKYWGVRLYDRSAPKGERNSDKTHRKKQCKETGKVQCILDCYAVTGFLSLPCLAMVASAKHGWKLRAGNETVLHTYPFTCCVLPNFVESNHFLEGLKDELLDQIFIEKNNDLYKFQQTDDLKKVSTPYVRGLRNLFSEDVMEWLKDVTGIPLSNKVDMTCSKYDYTDTLLCHDDELEERRIAYILYLVPPWKETDGGLLDMFSMDENCQPKDVVRSLVPQWNSFVWFEVTEASHHQVSEVLAKDKSRLSVNGWFHGPPISRQEPFIELPSPVQAHIPIDEDVVYEWINEIYLNPEIQSQIQEKFETDSEIELQGFIKESKYQSLVSALQSPSVQWSKRGPPNKRCYDTSAEDTLPSIVIECLTFFRSEALFLILSNLTGLSLHALAPNSDSESDESDTESPEIVNRGKRASVSASAPDKSDDSDDDAKKTTNTVKRRRLNSKKDKTPTCRAQVRRWTHGSYTLIHDTDAEGTEFALDAMLFCSVAGWQPECGGFTSYIAKGEDEELLTVNPAENSLALVYRDKETLKFVKHINNHISELQGDKKFFDIALTYFE